jgi:hypothetical protein
VLGTIFSALELTRRALPRFSTAAPFVPVRLSRFSVQCTWANTHAHVWSKQLALLLALAPLPLPVGRSFALAPLEHLRRLSQLALLLALAPLPLPSCTVMTGCVPFHDISHTSWTNATS